MLARMNARPAVARLALEVLAVSSIVAGCPSVETVPLASQFDAERAWAHLVKQVEIGPRPSGSEGAERCRAFLEAELRSYGLETKRETFTDTTPKGPIEFTNVYADLAPADANAKWVLLVSHYDTKLSKEVFVGANDAGSSTAALLEIARVLKNASPRPLGYRFLFVDGEEAVREHWQDPDNRYGSRHHAAQLKKSGEAERYAACVVLDMIADKELKLFRDVNSDPRLLETFFAAARKNGLAKYVDGPRQEVYDDHLSFMKVGIRSIDLIDLDFGPQNSWWHTTKDSLENCSKESLHAASKIALYGLVELEAQFTPKR